MVKLFIEKHTAVFVAALLIIIIGVMAYLGLPRESSPEIKQPWIFVTTVYPGVSPNDIETLVTIPIEEEIDGLEGVTDISSSSYQSVSSLWIEFSSDVDVETALRRVKERVDSAKPSLPEDAQEPTVKEFSSSDWPIFTITLSHEEGIERIDRQAKVLQEDLKRIYGVLDVEIAGNVEREVAIELDPLKLQHYDLSIDDVAGAIKGENMTIPGGTLKNETKNYSLAVTGEIKDADMFQDLVVKSGPMRIPLSELGDVRFKTAAPDTLSRLNGFPAITLEIKKRTGHNIIDIVDAAKELIEERKDIFPAGTNIVNSYDESTYIRDLIADMENNMFSGFVLVLAVTIFFLGGRNSLFVSLAIPFSMLISFFVLQLMGVTLNMIVLFSLILALGMLVDNGIVIVENIFRHASMGKSRIKAAIDGSTEVAGPIIASTITTCLAFFPIIFMPDIMGDFMKFLPITVIIVLLSSLVVALTINPVFCSQFLSISEKAKKKILEGSGLFHKFQLWYERGLRQAAKMPVRVTIIAFLVAMGGFVLYGFVGKEPVFMPNGDPGTAIIHIEARQGTPLQETDKFVRQIESVIPEVETPLDHYRITTGSPGSEEYHKATVRVEFKSYMDREISGEVGTENLRQALDGFTGADVTFEKIDNGPPSGNDLSYQITGQDYLVMGDLSKQIVSIFEEYPELKLINTDYEPAKPEVKVEIDREKAAFYGLSTTQIASTIRNSISGYNVGKYREGSDEYDIVVRYKDEYRDSLNHLRNLQVIGRDGERIPIQAVADISYRSSVGVIKRKDLKRSIEVWADFKEGVQNKTEIKAEIETRLANLSMPTGYYVGTGEGAQFQQESTEFLIQAFAVALFLIMVVLIAQFNSIVDPAIIIASVFLSMGGVFWGYAMTGEVFVIIMSGIGCIALAGVAVNNCIVLVDYTNVLMRQGMHWQEAIIESGKTRLRPVLLTAITTVLGMIPMAMGVSFDIHNFTFLAGSEMSEFWKAFAWAMIYGLSFATIMTLIVVPTMLTIKFKIKTKRKTRKNQKYIEDHTESARDLDSESDKEPALVLQ